MGNNTSVKKANRLNFLSLATVSLLITFLALLVLTFLFVGNQKSNLIHSQLEDRATKFSIKMAETVRLSVENLQAASGIIVFFEDTRFEQFKGVSANYFKSDPGLIVIEWQPVVKSASRQQFELDAREKGLPDFYLWEPDEQGNPIPAKIRQEHIPVLYMAAKNSGANDVNTIGLDLAWSENRIESKHLARDTGRAQSSELFKVVTGKTNDYEPLGFAITLPVYKNGYIPDSQAGRQKNLMGYMAGVYSIEMLMQPQIKQLLQEGFNIDVFDHLNNENRLVMNAGVPSNFSTEIDMEFFGNTLKLKLTATKAYIDKQEQLSWTLLPGVLVLFGLLAFVFLFLLKIKNQRLRQIQTELLVSNEQLDKLSRRDPLTDLYNRRAFNSNLKHELERLERHEYAVALLMLDLDLFKNVNDRWGHSVGDEVLIAFAKNCRKACRKIDTIARLGGEEFAILLPETTSEDAMIFAERIRQQTELLQIPIADTTHFCTITVSVGISIISQPMSPDKLIEQADKALYVAKQKGRNRVETYQ
ncbi:MAG: diguanylate cyclase [Thiotrichales bacterium]|nr:diguanylate cyclase [Thiotrichales bacterium]